MKDFIKRIKSVLAGNQKETENELFVDDKFVGYFDIFLNETGGYTIKIKTDS